MIIAMLGAAATLVATGFVFHASLLIWQLVFGFDGKSFWDGDHRFSVEQEKQRWWVYNQ